MRKFFFLNKMNNKPLFLPTGSVRAILIIFLTIFIALMLWYCKNVPESVLILWAGVFGWYFGGKNNNIKIKNGN